MHVIVSAICQPFIQASLSIHGVKWTFHWANDNQDLGMSFCLNDQNSDQNKMATILAVTIFKCFSYNEKVSLKLFCS